MSGPITDERDAILAALPASVGETHNHVPGRLVPPAAMALFAGMDREAGDTFNSLTSKYEVWLVMAAGANDKTTDDLDAIVWQSITALHAEGFTVEGIDQPFTYQIQNANYLTTIVRVANGMDITN